MATAARSLLVAAKMGRSYPHPSCIQYLSRQWSYDPCSVTLFSMSLLHQRYLAAMRIWCTSNQYQPRWLVTDKSFGLQIKKNFTSPSSRASKNKLNQPAEVRGRQRPTFCPEGWYSLSDFSSWRCKVGSSSPELEQKELWVIWQIYNRNYCRNIKTTIVGTNSLI